MADDKVILNIEAKADTRQAKKDLEDFSKGLKDANAKVTSSAEFKHNQADISLKAYKRLLDSIGKEIKTEAKIDTRSASASIQNILRKINAVKNANLNVNVKLKNSTSLANTLKNLDKINKNVTLNIKTNNLTSTKNNLQKIYDLLKGISKYSNVTAKVNADIKASQASLPNSTKRNSSINENDFLTYRQQGTKAQKAADFAAQSENEDAYNRNVKVAARAYNNADAIAEDIKNYKAQLNGTTKDLEDQYKTLSQIENEWKLIGEKSIVSGDRNGAIQARDALANVREQRQIVSQAMQENTFKGLDSEIKNIQSKMSNAISSGASQADLSEFQRKIVDLTKQKVQLGVETGQLSNSAGISQLNRVMPMANQLGTSDTAELQNLITNLGGTLNNVKQEAVTKKITDTTNEYNNLRRQAVQAVQAIDNAWKSGNGTTREETNLDNILKKMRQIKLEQGTLNAGLEKNLYTDLTSGLDNKQSRAYILLSERIKNAAVAQKEMRNLASDNSRDIGGSGLNGMSNIQSGAYITRFLGRSSKGWGSFGEAMAQLSTDLEKTGGTAAKFGETISMTSASIAMITAAVIPLVQTFSILSTVLEVAGRALVAFLQPGWETLNQKNAAVLSLTAAFQNMSTLNGQAVSKENAMSAAMNLSNQAMKDAAHSALSYQEILSAMQGTMPLLLGKGMNAQQAYDVTKGVAATAKITNLNPNQILQETRDLAQGTITAGHSQVANALGITNADITQYKGDVDGLMQYFEEKFANYEQILEDYSKTPKGAIEQFQETLGIAGSKILEKFAGPIVTIFTKLTNMLGQFNDETGDFELSPEMQRFAQILEDIALYLASCIDTIISWAEAVTDSDNALDAFETGMTDAIGVMTFLIDTTLALINGIIIFGRVIRAIIKPAVNLVGSLAHSFDALYQAMNGDTGGAKEQLNLAKQDVIAMTDISGAYNGRNQNSTWDQLFGHGDNRSYSGNTTGSIYQMVKQGFDSFNSAKNSINGTNPADLQGKQKQVEDEKARNKAIQAAQKLLKANREALKDALDDKLQALKDILEKNEIAYKEGFMSMQDYYNSKASADAQEAQDKLKEAQDELNLVKNTPYKDQSDQNRDIYQLNKEINKYTHELEKATREQHEVAQITAQSQEAMRNYVNRLNTQKDSSINNVGSASVANSFDTLFKVNPQTLQDRQDWFMQAAMLSGYSKENAAGIVGSATYESGGGLDPTITGTGNAKGIAQWDETRWNNLLQWAATQNSDPMDFRTQVMFLLHEIAEGTEKGNFLEQSRTVAQATTDFSTNVERPNPTYLASSLNDRINYAQQAYNNFNVPVLVAQGANLGNQIGASIGQGINSALDVALSENGGNLLYAQMPNLQEGCVEAATRLGAYFSPALAEAVKRGIVNTDNLDAFLTSQGIPEDKDTSHLDPGDLVFFDTDQVNGHVLVVKDANNYVGNSSHMQNPKYGGESGIELQSIANYPYPINHIARTGTNGLASQFSATGYMSQIQADTTKLSEEVRDKYYDAMHNLNSVLATNESNIFGQYKQQIYAIAIDYDEKMRKGRSQYSADPQTLNLYLDQMTKEMTKKMKDKLKEIVTNVANTNIKIMERNAPLRGYEIQSGVASFSELAQKTLGYIQNINSGNQYWLGNQLKVLEDLSRYYESIGDVNSAVDIRENIANLRDKGYNIVKGWIDNISKQFDNVEARMENEQYTNLQKENADKNLKVIRNFALKNARQSLEDQFISAYGDLDQSIAQERAEQSKYAKDSTDYKKLQSIIEQNKFEQEKIQIIADENHQQLELNKQLSRQIELMEEAGNVGKQAIEDGLVTFLTDGINEAKSLGDAFRDLLTSILKEMQKFFAKKLVTNFMNRLFPSHDNSTDDYTAVENLSRGTQFREPQNTDYLMDSYQRSFNAFFNSSQTASLLGSQNLFNSSSSIDKALSKAYNNNNDYTFGNPLTQYTANWQLSNAQSTIVDSTKQAQANELANSISQYNMNLYELTDDTSVLAQTFTNLQVEAQKVANTLSGISMMSTTSSSTAIDSTVKAATGGYISGAGTSTSDSIPSLLSNGEYVVKAETVRKMGRNYLDAINSGAFTKIPVKHFATGGLVGDSIESTARGISSFAQAVGTNVSTTNNMNIALVENREEAVSHFMKSPKGQKILVDFAKNTANITSRFAGSF